jgi:hypothetical protein
MKADKAERLRDAAPSAEFLTEALAHAPGHAHHGLESVRRARHGGREIVVRTTYEITVDGKPLMGHLFVTNDGDLHSHALPNYVFHSAIDMVKKIIDLFPEEFSSQDHGGGHGGHSHEHR